MSAGLNIYHLNSNIKMSNFQILDAALAEIAEQRKLVAQSMIQTAMLIQTLQNQK